MAPKAFIGKHAYRVGEADALSCVAGYCIMDDVSERFYQHEPVDRSILAILNEKRILNKRP